MSDSPIIETLDDFLATPVTPESPLGARELANLEAAKAASLAVPYAFRELTEAELAHPEVLAT